MIRSQRGAQQGWAHMRMQPNLYANCMHTVIRTNPFAYRRTGNHSCTCQNLGLREKFLRFARTVWIFTSSKTGPETPPKPHKSVLDYLAASHFSRLCEFTGLEELANI